MQSLDSYIPGHLWRMFQHFSLPSMLLLQASEASEAGMDSVEAALDEAEKTVGRCSQLYWWMFDHVPQS